MSNRALTLYDTDSDSDASSLAGDRRPMASMSIANDPCRRDDDSDRFSLDSDLETTYTDDSGDYITSEQAQKYNPAGLRVEARRTLDYDSESDDDGDATRGFTAQDIGGFNRSVMRNGMRDDESSIGSDDDYDPMITGRKDLPSIFVRGDAELSANLPVGHARDKTITTSTINAETGEKEIHQYREGEQERPRVVRVVSSATKSAEIVAQALAKARADKTAMKRAMGVEGEATLTESEKKGVVARTKILRGVQAGAKEVKKEATIRTAQAELPPERQAQVQAKADQYAKKKELLGELKGKAEKEGELAKVEAQVKKAVDKRLLGEAFKRMKAEAQARALLRTVGTKIAKTVAEGKIKATFSKIVSEMKARAKQESDELEAEISKQQRQALANLLSAKGFSLDEGEGGEEGSTLAGGGGGTTTTAGDPKSVAISTAKAELERLSAEVEPINVDGKELVVGITAGGKRQLKLGGKLLTSNQANIPALLKIQAELGKTRRTDPVANAIREIVDKRLEQARSTRGKGALGGQGKRSSTPAKAGGGASGGGASGGGAVVRRKLKAVVPSGDV